MYATARDYGRLGQLMLHQGKFNGQQIIPLWYFHEMISPSLLDTEDGIPNYRYGLHLWSYTENNQQIPYCRGIKGQYIIAIPEENLLIIRLGEERKSSFTIPKGKENDAEFLAKYKYKVGHPKELFKYISLGKWMKSTIDKK